MEGFVSIFIVPICRDRHGKAVAPSCTRLHQVAELPPLGSISLSLPTLSASLMRQNIPLRPIHRPYRRFLRDLGRSGSSGPRSERSGPLSVLTSPNFKLLNVMPHNATNSSRNSCIFAISKDRKTVIKLLINADLEQLIFSLNRHDFKCFTYKCNDKEENTIKVALQLYDCPSSVLDTSLAALRAARSVASASPHVTLRLSHNVNTVIQNAVLHGAITFAWKQAITAALEHHTTQTCWSTWALQPIPRH